ncbi:GTP pyrophosphokinase [Romboutsia ilealis]|uniref:GTP pyrophosphokinase n=1 Tax=Romboutsia faecis TaxID=2764597 RepID=A0ABR7JQ85_9FIRM|nr:GTP pyrophosphokinase [Romboutsia faecis]MBC5996923.1 GTP pyrophosphokinase [Romboutsia faecis]MRN24575.1 GTP pyrophosphokinase [Romboutsia ilealis]
MGLLEFDFIEESIDKLKSMSSTLELIGDELEEYFEVILDYKEEEYINVTSRVKSECSLREKIIRNRYLKKYNEASNLIHNLTDLIGVRIECRFIEDENKIYRVLRRYFNKTDDKVYYYNKENPNIKLKLSEKQPKKQKNGFEIYRIDGKFNYLDRQIKFELQIKSLVNIFWSEIEHKVIYKNNTYLLGDSFLKDMMLSIKNNLTMIDNQLVNVYKNFNTGSFEHSVGKKKELEKLLAKMAHDTFSMKMKESIGFIVDFKKPCETILNYSFNKNEEDVDDSIFGDLMINGLSRINEISKKEIDFNQPILFDKKPVLKDDFCKKLGKYIMNKLNDEFAWNLFFRILFEIEPHNNKEDFENFISFIKMKVISKDSQEQILSTFKDEGNIIINDIYMTICKIIIEVDTVETMYDYNLEKINYTICEITSSICRDIEDYEGYLEVKEDTLNNIDNRISKIFN